MEEIIPNTRTMPPGPFAMAYRHGDLVFVSGQVAFDGEKGEPVLGGIKEQTRQTLKNLKTVLETAGSSLDEVIKLNCILPNFPTDYVGFNEVFKEFFPGPRYPARTSFQAGLLGGLIVEIEAIAVCRD
jgi:2-iminobutanoate/2-iminopropanoate deaminase